VIAAHGAADEGAIISGSPRLICIAPLARQVEPSGAMPATMVFPVAFWLAATSSDAPNRWAPALAYAC
jgi:hypothetical protein